MTRMVTATRMLIGAWVLTAACMATAQEYPSRPIRMIVMPSPGSSGDLILRSAAPELSKILGQPLVMENMPGAGGILAARLVARQAPADGYTLLSTASTVLATQIVSKDIGLDFSRDLAPISILAEGPIIFVTPAGAPWANFNDMVAYARANPGKLNSAVVGPTDFTALFMHVIRQRFGVNIVDIPYKGAGAAYIPATVANEVQMAFGGEVQIAGGVANKTLRILAISGSQRMKNYPDAPTFEEYGVQGVDSTLNMMFAPIGTPAPVLDRLNAAVVKALAVPEVRERIVKATNWVVSGSSREALGQAVALRLQRYQTVANNAGIRPE